MRATLSWHHSGGGQQAVGCNSPPVSLFVSPASFRLGRMQRTQLDLRSVAGPAVLVSITPWHSFMLLLDCDTHPCTQTGRGSKERQPDPQRRQTKTPATVFGRMPHLPQGSDSRQSSAQSSHGLGMTHPSRLHGRSSDPGCREISVIVTMVDDSNGACCCHGSVRVRERRPMTGRTVHLLFGSMH